MRYGIFVHKTQYPCRDLCHSFTFKCTYAHMHAHTQYTSLVPRPLPVFNVTCTLKSWEKPGDEATAYSTVPLCGCGL